MPAVMMLNRGIRRVPLDFKHPKTQRYDMRTMTYVDHLQPKFDEFYVVAVRRWLADRELWGKGEHPGQSGEYASTCTFEEYEGNGPDPDAYYPGEAWPDGAEMGICMYESVTEGTPISSVYLDTAEGRRAMAEQIAREDTSITSALTAADWLAVIEADAIPGTDVATGKPVSA